MITITVPTPGRADSQPVTQSQTQIFGSNDGAVVNGVPQVTPTTQTALFIDDDGTQYQWFDSAWH